MPRSLTGARLRRRRASPAPPQLRELDLGRPRAAVGANPERMRAIKEGLDSIQQPHSNCFSRRDTVRKSSSMAARQGPWSPPSPPGVCELHLLSPPQGRAAWRPAWRGKARPPNPALPAAARDDDGQRDDRVRRQGGDRTAIGGGSWGGAAGAGPIIVEEASMECSKSFIQALQELKNLPPQLYSASEYCEKSYLHSEQKQMVQFN